MKKLLVIIIFLAVLCSVYFLGFILNKKTLKERPVRIVLITLDTLRYDTFMGDSQHDTRMPLTFKIAQNGAIYTHFYSATSTTQPSHATFFTGMQPWEHGVVGNGQKLSESLITLPEILHENGFTTHAVVASFPLSSQMGFAQGFDQYSENFENQFSGKEHEGYSLADSITKTAILEIDNATGKKQFFWFHFFDAHEPYGNTFNLEEAVSSGKLLYKAVRDGRSPKEIDQIVNLEKCRDFYNRDVNYLDKFLSKLFVRIATDNEKFETHIIVVSDHGEGFGEEGSVAHSRRISYPLIHVPLVIVSPGLKAQNVDDFVSSLDIMPTILDMADISYQAKKGGYSLLNLPKEKREVWGMRRVFDKPYREPRLDGKFHLLDKYLFYTISKDGLLIRGNKDKIITEKRDETGTTAEYHLKIKKDFAQFEKKIVQHRNMVVPDKKTIKKLKGLGYVQ